MQTRPRLLGLALATIIRRTEIRSLNDDFPLALPYTMVAAAPIHAQVNARRPRLTE